LKQTSLWTSRLLTCNCDTSNSARHTTFTTEKDGTKLGARQEDRTIADMHLMRLWPAGSCNSVKTSAKQNLKQRQTQS
jgi:hypothetical protein